MNALRSLLGELFGLFVEDRMFAIAIAASIALVAVLSRYTIGTGAQRGLVLFVCLASVLLASVVRAARSKG